MMKSRLPISSCQLFAGIGTTFLLISVIGALYDSRSFFQSYLFSFLFWSDLPLGSIPLLMIFSLTGGKWGLSIQRFLEAFSNTVLGIAFSFIPILIGLHQIYPWLDPKIASEPHVQHKLAYLNAPFFSIRTLLYFFVWIALNQFLQVYSKYREKTSPIERERKLKKISAGGLVLLSLISTFASIDWQMSIEPKWYSTLYGLVYLVGQSLSAFALILVVFGYVAKADSNESTPPETALLDLGNILLTLVMVWAYLSFMQYLIIWMGNLPHEVLWFQHRTQGGWEVLALLLFLFQFAAPFTLLLFRSMKNHLTRLAWIGSLVFTIRILDHYWMLFPGLPPHHFQVHWQVITTWLALGGIWFSLFLRKFNSSPISHSGEIVYGT